MFDYLQKFNSLPKDLRDKVSAPETMRAILELEEKYKVDLAAAVMKVMVKSIAFDKLAFYFSNDLGLPVDQAEKLKDEMSSRIFGLVSSHLGLMPAVSAPAVVDNLDIAIKTAGIVLPSADLQDRLKKILSTYEKGIRNKIDTRVSLSKKVEQGGLNLSDLEIERIFKALAGKISAPVVNEKIDKEKEESRAKLDRIIMAAEAVAVPALASGAKPALAGYDLRKSIEEMKKNQEIPKENKAKENKVEIKKIEAPEELELLPLPEEELLLVAGKKSLEIGTKTNLPEIKKEAPKTPEVKKEEPKIEKLEIAKAPEIKKEVEAPSLPIEAKIEKIGIKTQVEEIEKKEAEPKKIEEEIKPLPVNMNFKRPEPIATGSRPRIQDIKPVPKIMSPIEELAFLDLVNFRRLGTNAEEITNKIFSKIKLLEKDGYDKMIQGVSAWRKSEVGRLYLKIGQEAVFNGTSLRDAVLARQKEKKPCLNLEEIEAISKLNSRLAF